MFTCLHIVIQGDPGGTVNILGGDIIGHFEGGNKVSMYLLLSGYRDKAL